MQSTGDRLWLSKFVSGFVATAVQMTFRDQKKKKESQEEFGNDHRRWKSDLCPLCLKTKETIQHVLQCDCKQMAKCRKKTLTTIKRGWISNILIPLYHNASPTYSLTMGIAHLKRLCVYIP